MGTLNIIDIDDEVMKLIKAKSAILGLSIKDYISKLAYDDSKDISKIIKKEQKEGEKNGDHL